MAKMKKDEVEQSPDRSFGRVVKEAVDAYLRFQAAQEQLREAENRVKTAEALLGSLKAELRDKSGVEDVDGKRSRNVTERYVLVRIVYDDNRDMVDVVIEDAESAKA